MSLNAEIEALARKYAPKNSQANATVEELCKLFQIPRRKAQRLFADAVIPGPRFNKFSRNRVAEIVSEANGRDILYPAEPLMNQKQAAEYLKSLGRKFGEQSLERARVKGSGPVFFESWWLSSTFKK